VFIVIYMGVGADTTGEDRRKVVILLRILTIYMPVYDYRSTSSQSSGDIWGGQIWKITDEGSVVPVSNRSCKKDAYDVGD
jgi:hypothetical protein